VQGEGKCGCEGNRRGGEKRWETREGERCGVGEVAGGVGWGGQEGEGERGGCSGGEWKKVKGVR